MTQIYFGTDEIPRHWEQYFTRCNALELDLEELEHPPRIDTLNRWRVESPRGFAFVLHADPAVSQGLAATAESGSSELTDAIRAGWESTLENAHALAARAVLVKTPVSFGPGKTAQSLMEQFADELADDFKYPVIWDAAAGWETESTRQWTADCGLTFAYDPFLAFRDEIGLHHGDGAFVLSERAGLRREFDRRDIMQLIDAVGSYDRAYFLLRGRFQWKYAEHFGELLDYQP